MFPSYPEELCYTWFFQNPNASFNCRFIPMPFPTWSTDVAFVFLSLFIQGLPFLLLGALISGLVTVFVPLRTLFAHLPKNPLPAALLGACFGFLVPSCE